MDIVDLLIVGVLTLLTAAYFGAWRHTNVRAALGVYAVIGLGALALTFGSLAYMQQGYSGTRGTTLIGWPQTLCEGYSDGEFAHRYPISNGLNYPLSGNARAQLQSCQISPPRWREDAGFYAALLLIAAILFRLHGRTKKAGTKDASV